jgi:hypothetical protein
VRNGCEQASRHGLGGFSTLSLDPSTLEMFLKNRIPVRPAVFAAGSLFGRQRFHEMSIL